MLDNFSFFLFLFFPNEGSMEKYVLGVVVCPVHACGCPQLSMEKYVLGAMVCPVHACGWPPVEVMK
jgi:hypothetical protein